METIKNILIDSLNGFSLRYIPLFLFQLLVAGLMGNIMQKLLNRKFEEKLGEQGTLIAVVVTLLTAISKNSLPFTVMAAAAVLILAIGTQRNKLETISLFLTISIGIGCGVGSIIQTVIGGAFIAIVLLFLPLKNEIE